MATEFKIFKVVTVLALLIADCWWSPVVIVIYVACLFLLRRVFSLVFFFVLACFVYAKRCFPLNFLIKLACI